MALKESETSFEFKPELPDNLSRSEKKALLTDIGDYLVTEILTYVADGNSPVSGYGEFKKLNPNYAENQKTGDRTPNLELNGDMLEALTFEIVGDAIKVGIFDDDQAIKSYGHNTGMKGHPTLEGKVPVRRFIPDKDEKLKKDITGYVETIIQDFLDDKSED